MNFITISAHIAERLHTGQVRKWIGEPYFEHCKEVAVTVAKMGGPPHAVAAAYLHDVIEDTPTTLAELWAELVYEGVEVDDADLICVYVDFMTDKYASEAYPNLNRKERKRLEAERIVSQCDCADEAILKIADWESNSPSIQEHDPEFWAVCCQEKAMYMYDIYFFIPTKISYG